ncbi:MAG: hypothetical protein LBF56_04025 [Holosporales bacterium]|jgi:hypothetical protein|nr:hypothetical protein [Holosporales bacterium]
MPELLINQYLDKIVFSVLAVAVLFFSSAAILFNDTRTAVANFLAASISVAGLIALLSNTVIAIVIAVIYVSVCSLFLLIPSRDDHRVAGLLPIKTLLIAVSAAILTAFLVCMHFKTVTIVEMETEHYSGIAGISLLMSLVFILVIAGIVSIWDHRKQA